MSEHNRETLRKHFRAARQSLSRKQQNAAASALVHQINKYDICQQATRVAIYKTNDDELGTHALIEHFWGNGLEVYLPVIHPFSPGYLLFLRYLPHTKMRKNQYGIDEPQLDVRDICLLADLDLVFTPVVAFDEQGNRLGMGGGFYDRTLASVLKPQDSLKNESSKTCKGVAKAHTSDHNNPMVIGLAHDIQKASKLPLQSWDIPLPYILTPTQFYAFGASN